MPRTFRDSASAAGLPVSEGLQALARKASQQIHENREHYVISGSSDIDSHFKDQEPDANRWDYAIGVRIRRGRLAGKERVIWVEVHPGSEVSKVLAKFDWLKEKLATPAFSELKRMTGGIQAAGTSDLRFVWICTGAGKLPPHNKDRKRLSQRGIIYTSRLELP